MKPKKRLACVLLTTLGLISTGAAGTAHAMAGAIFIVAGAMMGGIVAFSGHMAQYEQQDRRGHGTDPRGQLSVPAENRDQAITPPPHGPSTSTFPGAGGTPSAPSHSH